MKHSGKTGFLITFLIGFLLLSVIYPKVLFAPNQYMFNKTGDGNYFIYAWHIKHDKSFSHFDGISYPYGESISMDSLHIYSSFMKVVSLVFPASEKYAIGFLNFLILISVCFGAAFIYLIFIHFQLPVLISVLAANAIAFLSSQVWLLSPWGHYGLTFVCFFPMAWYFLIRYYDKPNILTSALIGLNIIFWTFSHVYLGFIISLFVLLFHLISLLLKRKLPQKAGPFILSLFIQLAGPFIVFLVLHISAGQHPDRINMPFTTDYSNTFSSVFFPVHSPFQSLYFWARDFALKTNSWNKIGVYIGLAANIILVLSVVKAVLALAKGNGRDLKPYFSRDLDLYLISAFVLLLYSMAIPTKYLPEDILNKLPLITQFSSLGRFGWGFYYVINVFCIVFIFRLTGRLKGWKYLSYAFIFIIFAEGLQIHIIQAGKISQYPNLYLEENLSENQKLLTRIPEERFQAILPLPYYFKFSVPVTSPGTDSSILYSQLAAYYSGLPIMSTYLSRPSVSETMNIYRQLLPFPFHRPVEKVVSDGRDILVITCNTDSPELNANEKLILQKSELLETNSDISLFRLCTDSLSSNDNGIRKDSFITAKLYPNNKLLVSDTTHFFIFHDYEEINSDIAYLGRGAYKGIKDQYSVLCDTPLCVFDTSLTYRLSLWYYNYLWDQTYATLVINEKDSCGKDLLYDYYSPVKGELIDDWWYLSERIFKVRSDKGRLKIFIHGRDLFKNEIYIDQFLLKPEDLTVYQTEKTETGSIILKNNIKYCITVDQDQLLKSDSCRQQ